MESIPTFVPSTGVALGGALPACACTCRSQPRRGLRASAPATVRMAAGAPAPPPGDGGARDAADSGSEDGNQLRDRLERQLLLTLVPTNVHEDGVMKDGRTSCLWCAGSGRSRCTWCKGTGTRMQTVLKSWAELTEDIDNALAGQPVPQPETVPVRCSCCDGTREMRCSKCRGSGTGSYGHAY